MFQLPKNVWILSIGQALLMSISTLVVFVGGIIGGNLAPTEKLATLPVALSIVGTAVAVYPVTSFMKWAGRRKAILAAIAASVLIALMAGYSIISSNFYLFCFSTFLFGINNASVLQFRFAAMESVRPELMPNAASAVLIGGIVAAFIGPELALLGKDILPSPFAGSFVLIAVVLVIAFVVLTFYNNTKIEEDYTGETSRSIVEIAKQPVFWVAVLGAATGYAIMSFIMTATPISMHVMDGHSLSDTKFVIQSHIVAMFAPSIITGWIINKFGIPKMMIAGLLSYVLCLVIAYSDHLFINYWISLFLLGIGWNFLFIGGTALLPSSYLPQEKFKVQALNELMVFGSQAIASLSAGWIIYAVGWEAMLSLVIPFILLQFGIMAVWKYKS